MGTRKGCECHLIPTLRRLNVDPDIIRLVLAVAANDPDDPGFLAHMRVEEMILFPHLSNEEQGVRILTLDHSRYRRMMRLGQRIDDKDLERHTKLEINMFSKLM